MTLLTDASVLLKAFVVESGHVEAKALLTGTLDVVVPDVAFDELARLVHRKVSRGEMTEAHGLAVLDAAPSYVRAVGITGPLVRRGYEIGREIGATPTDGLYLACAEALNARIVTSDLVLAARSQGTPWESRLLELGAPIYQ